MLWSTSSSFSSFPKTYSQGWTDVKINRDITNSDVRFWEMCQIGSLFMVIVRSTAFTTGSRPRVKCEKLVFVLVCLFFFLLFLNFITKTLLHLIVSFRLKISWQSEC